MRILLFEFVTGGGWFLVDRETPPDGSLLREGAAMQRDLAEDFSQLPDVELLTLHDARLTDSDEFFSLAVKDEAELWAQLSRLAAEADFVLVIAPELDHHLQTITEHVLDAGAQLLSPGVDLIRLAADKHRTALHLASHGIRVAAGKLVAAGESILPSETSRVVKPRFGAGSQQVQILSPSDDALHAPTDYDRRVERYYPGLPVSVSCLLGGEEPLLLPTCSQQLSTDGRFAYQGGQTPLAQPLDHRARDLARSAIDTLPPSQGLIGVDMILGESADGRDDVVIEINPRVTTSYVGLRRLTQANLAAAMIDVACGRAVSLCFDPARVEFTADGKTQLEETARGLAGN